ncbi:MAG: T9SS type A sorting domain-containing protein [Paludibacter sp.]|nr:T9SS type A sorting domain-containing protein [Paludibacter sp.]
MKKNVFKTVLIFIISMLSFSNAFGQTFPVFNDATQIFPENPTPTDSVYVAYFYQSGDACPDFYLEIDSIDEKRVFVSKKQIPDMGRMCALVITKFKAVINIGTFSNYTEIYFDGRLIGNIDPMGCKMDMTGQVISVTGNSSIIQAQNSRDMYIINDVLLNEGTLVKFHGTKIQCFTTPCYNIVDCYEIIEKPACVMNKKGVVVAGRNACAGQLFIQEFSPISSMPQLFLIQPEDNIILPEDSAVETTVDGLTTIATGEVNPDSTVTVEPGYSGLKEGDKVIFGGYYVKNEKYDPNVVCRYVGIATCYELVDPVTPPECVMDKEGIVVVGKGDCANRLFVQELTPFDNIPRLYEIMDQGVISSDGSYESNLNVGDKVIFGSFAIENDSTKIDYAGTYNYCRIAGFVNCYQLVEAAENFSLAGQAIAEDSIIIQSGTAVLFEKGYRKAQNWVPLNSNGTFEFTGLPYGEYTVLVIPDIRLYKKYLPTFYINKLRYKRADFVTLNEDLKDLTVKLRSYKRPNGNGKIYGNIFFESTTLKDSVIAANGTNKMSVQSDAKIADNLSVVLYNMNDEPIDWTVTDTYGNYAFENIAFDSYKIVSETAAASGETNVTISNENGIVNADLMLKSSEFQTDIRDYQITVPEIYPNPVSDYLTITLAESQKVGIYNTMGQEVLNKQLNEGSNSLNMTSMEKGVYFITIGPSKMKVIKK